MFRLPLRACIAAPQHRRRSAAAAVVVAIGAVRIRRSLADQAKPPRGAAAADAVDSELRSGIAALRNRRAALASEKVLDAATVVAFLSERRFDDVEAVDVRNKCSWTNEMVFATGQTERQMLAAANALVKQFREIIPTCREDRPVIEADDKWIVIDCGLVVVHLFSPAGRRLYKLDALWKARPDLDDAAALDADAFDDAQFDELDNLEDDEATEAHIAAAVEQARLNPADFGLVGTASSSSFSSSSSSSSTAQTRNAAPLVRGRLMQRKQRGRLNLGFHS